MLPHLSDDQAGQALEREAKDPLIGIAQREVNNDRHLAEESRIGGDEADGFDDPTRRRHFHEPYVDHVLPHWTFCRGKCARLAGKTATSDICPDPRVQAVVKPTREAKMVQAIDQLRLIHKPANLPVEQPTSSSW